MILFQLMGDRGVSLLVVSPALLKELFQLPRRRVELPPMSFLRDGQVAGDRPVLLVARTLQPPALILDGIPHRDVALPLPRHLKTPRLEGFDNLGTVLQLPRRHALIHEPIQ